MASHNAETVESNLNELTKVAEAREEKLKDAELETWSDVAGASVEELSEVLTYAGEETAKRVKGSAQGHVKQLAKWDWVDVEELAVWNDDDDDEDEDAYDSVGTLSSDEKNVLVLGSEEKTDDELGESGPQFAERPPKEAKRLIQNALNRFGLEPDVLAWPADDMGAVQAKAYYKEECRDGQWEDDRWDEHFREFHVEPYVDIYTDDEDNTDWSAVYEERDRQMLNWADHVVVVEDGGFVFTTTRLADDVADSPVVHTYLEQDQEWTPDEDRGVGPDINTLQSKHGESDPLDEAPEDHYETDYQNFNQYEGSEAAKYKGEGEGVGSASYDV